MPREYYAALASHLLTGLDDTQLIRNPREVFRELSAHSAQGDNQDTDQDLDRRRDGNPKRTELTELEIELHSDAASLSDKLPQLINTCDERSGSPGDGKPFVCQCAVLEIDRQRALYCASKSRDTARSVWPPEQISRTAGSGATIVGQPDCESQLQVFGLTSRNELAKRLQLTRRIRRTADNVASKDDWTGDKRKHMRENNGDDRLSLGLYKLEQLLREANVNLGANLSTSAELSAQKLGRLLAASSSSIESGAQRDHIDSDDLIPIAMIRAPVSSSRRFAWAQGNGLRVALNFSSGDSGIGLAGLEEDNANNENNNSNDENADTGKLHARGNFGALDWHVRFRSSGPVQSIASYSISLFRDLLDECPLFGSSLMNGNAPDTGSGEQAKFKSLSELKLYACVECQKLRATIRFKWISECLALAFGHKTSYLAPTSKRTRKGLRKVYLNYPSDYNKDVDLETDLEHLPPVDRIARELELERKYFDLLALVMGQLLRRHFIEPALDRWCSLLEEHQLTEDKLEDEQCGVKTLKHLSKTVKLEPKLIVQVELVETSDSSSSSATNQLTCSRPDRQLGQLMGFVADELVSTCGQLPRLETQLGDLQAAESRPLLELPARDDDDLLAGAKARLARLIGRSLPINISGAQEVNIDACKQRRSAAFDDKWNNPDYLLVVELINRFRQGTIADFGASLVEELIALSAGANDVVDWSERVANALKSVSSQNQQREEPPEGGNVKLRQLQLSCKQIRLLNSLELRLNCHSNTFYDFGFVLLDCEPLRKSLLNCVEKERNLLVRLNLDDLLKLMERLRLQFDEIELGLDLEASIEDYLAERWQAKHREQPQQQQLILADNIDDDDDNFDANFDANLDEVAPFNHSPGAENFETTTRRSALETDGDIREAFSAANRTTRDDDDSALLSGKQMDEKEDEFVEALTSGSGNTAQANQQLLVLRGATSATKSGQILAAEELASGFERRVAPLVECKLLVGRYEHLSELLNVELEPLISDLEVTFEGLVFLSEFVGADQLEPSHSELISELSARSQEFTDILSESLKRLDLAALRLIKLNELRRQVLSKLVIEFHLLMVAISRRQLASSSSFVPVSFPSAQQQQQQQQQRSRQDTAGSVESSSLNIRQLDSIQEASDWAQKLEVRCDFLSRQNSLLARENHLLSRARLAKKEDDTNDIAPGSLHDEMSATEEETQNRDSILARWRLLVAAIANLWRLAEDYETQQVKWLNSDIKRIDFAQIDSTFNKFQTKLDRLREDCRLQLLAEEPLLKAAKSVLLANVNELQARLNQFANMRIPIFMFLTNKHLTAAHWNKLTNLLEADKLAAASQTSGSSISPQACTTLAQFLDLNVDKHVAALIEINKEAINEHQLTMFLLMEAARSALLEGTNKHLADNAVKVSVRELDVSAWLDNWSDDQLIVAATRFIETKLEQCASDFLRQVDCFSLASKLMRCHSLAKRYLELGGALNIDLPRLAPINYDGQTNSTKVTIRSSGLLSSSSQIRPALFVEFLRLFTQNWIQAQIKLATKITSCERRVKTLGDHLSDIEQLVERIRQVNEGDLRRASIESEQLLSYLEQQTVKLELEREILATKEALALEQQRKALTTRDECIRQITERAIPAIRAATKALDCLDERSLRFLRCVKPSPPEPVRLVVEAVCLLRSCTISDGENYIKPINRSVTPKSGAPRCRLEPERHFDAVRGIIIEDYWPVASRMLIGTHSQRFISDLRKVVKKTIPANVMELIRKRYLSSSYFNVRLIEKVSRECALLAKWLIAVDVFNRVINIVKPNYRAYMESEKKLNDLLFEVENRRREIESIGSELQQMEDSFEMKVAHKMALVESLDQCRDQLKHMEDTRLELIEKRSTSCYELAKLKRKRRRSTNKCLLQNAKTVYVDAMRSEEQRAVIELLRGAISRRSAI